MQTVATGIAEAKPRSRILVNSAVLMAGQLTTWALTLVFTIYVVRRIGPAGWGDFSIATALTALVSTVAALGIGTLMVRDIARDRTLAPRMIGTAVIARLLVAIPSLLVIGAVCYLAHYPWHTQMVVMFISVAMVLQMLTGPFATGFQAFEHMKFNSLSDVISKALVSFASIALVLVGQGALAISIVSAAASLIVLLLNVYWWRGFGRVSYRLDLRLLRYLVIGGLPFWATGIFLTIYMYIDSVMLSFMTTPTVVGYYGAPTKLFSTLLFVPVIFGTAIFPELSRTFRQAPHQMRQLARRSFNLVLCLSLPVAAGGMLLSAPIIEELYGPQFTPSIWVMVVLAGSLVPTYLNILTNQFLIAADRQIAWTKVMAAASILNPLINLFLISYFQQTHHNGAFGAALALLITEALMMLAALVLLPPGTLGWPNVVTALKSLTAVALMVPFVWLTRWMFLGVPVVLGTIVYLVAIVVLRALPTEDLAVAGTLLSHISSKLKLGRLAGATPRWVTMFAADLRMWKWMGPDRRDAEHVRLGEALSLWYQYPGVRATLTYRLSQATYRRLPLVPRLLYRHNLRRYALDIAPTTSIGPGLYLADPTGTSVWAKAVGSRVTLLRAVTIGNPHARELPVIEDGAILADGCRVLGSIRIGAQATVGMGAIVVQDVPPHATAISTPARVLGGARVPAHALPVEELREALTETRPVPAVSPVAEALPERAREDAATPRDEDLVDTLKTRRANEDLIDTLKRRRAVDAPAEVLPS
jgi:O-antigen/teichoic acid export membrane protein/serine acetyltransferase